MVKEAGAAGTGWLKAMGKRRPEIADRWNSIERSQVQGEAIGSDDQVRGGYFLEQLFDRSLSIRDNPLVKTG